MSDPPPVADVEVRVERFARDANLTWVAEALMARREEILGRWLVAAAAQPFHRGHPERAVADDIPRLFDGLVGFLLRHAPRPVDPGPPLDDPAVLAPARSHAEQRARQGLEPADVVVEFRLLRQEIWRALRTQLPDGAPSGDSLGANMLINDTLDGAITIGLEALVQRIEALRQELLATTMHEVRQPLTAIKGAAQLAARQLRNPAADAQQISGTLGIIESQANRMATLLSALLDASRIALGALELKREAVDLAALLGETIAGSGPDTEARVRTDVPAGLRTGGLWDPVRLRQVVANLVSNAAKYSPPDTPIEVTLSGDEDTIELSVRDHGIGVQPADLPRLFRRFSRTPDAIERGVEGLGLGLYLCHGVVEAHGGRIWVESDGPGHGTTMRVRLPRRAPAEPTP